MTVKLTEGFIASTLRDAIKTLDPLRLKSVIISEANKQIYMESDDERHGVNTVFAKYQLSLDPKPTLVITFNNKTINTDEAVQIVKKIMSTFEELSFDLECEFDSKPL